MNEKLPYEDELNRQLHHLPLPDEEQAWQKMKKLLDEEDNNRKIPPLFFLKSCGGWSLLFVLLTGIGLWFIFKPQQWLNREHKVAVSSSPEKKSTTSTTEEVARKNSQKIKQQTELKRYDDSSLAMNKKQNADDKTEERNRNISKQEWSIVTEKNTSRKITERNNIVIAKKVIPKTKAAQKGNIKKDVATAKSNSKKDKYSNTNERNEIKKDEESTTQDTMKESRIVVNDVAPKSQPVKDTSTTKQKEAEPPSLKNDSVAKEKNVSEKRQRKQWFGAGLAVQQQIPFSGQKAVPYNYLGRKGSLADYVPSVYVRLYSAKNWFIQLEFRYGAPQYTKEFIYTQRFQRDSGFGGPVVTNTFYRLKKTYYHQLPASFNYVIKPNWSVGAGVVYSRFYSAISEEEVRQRLLLQPDTLVSKRIVVDKVDSTYFFRRSNLQALLETQYHWKRFSVGARYIQGLQPYINYTDAAGVLRKEKNHSLQVFIRYQLWRQRKEKQ